MPRVGNSDMDDSSEDYEFNVTQPGKPGKPAKGKGGPPGKGKAGKGADLPPLPEPRVAACLEEVRARLKERAGEEVSSLRKESLELPLPTVPLYSACIAPYLCLSSDDAYTTTAVQTAAIDLVRGLLGR